MGFDIYLCLFGMISVLTCFFSSIINHFVIKKEYDRTIKMDITVDQMVMLEKRLSEFLRNNQLEESADINEIANVLNVSMGGEYSNLLTQAQLSDPDEFGMRKVNFKKGLSLETKLFVYAHECAHLINKDTAPFTRPEGGNKSYIEQLADYSAAAMLMPREEVYKYLEKNFYLELPPKKRVNIIYSLCRKYHVNDVIALRRVKEIYKMKQL